MERDEYEKDKEHFDKSGRIGVNEKVDNRLKVDIENKKIGRIEMKIIENREEEIDQQFKEEEL